MRALFLLFSVLILSQAAKASTIDLNNFFADPSVVVASDGSSASFTEDLLFSSVILSNDPGLGDPEVIVAAPNRFLSFDYAFSEPDGNGNDDQFFASLLDATTGASLGAPYEFSTSSSSSGTVRFDLTSLVGTSLGLQFNLNALFGDSGTDSTLTVSNLTIAAIPLPASLPLLAFGAAALAWIGRRKVSDAGKE